VTGPQGAFRRSGVKTTPRRRLELVRFAAQPSKGGPRGDWNPCR